MSTCDCALRVDGMTCENCKALPPHLQEIIDLNEEGKGNLHNRFIHSMAESYGIHISNPPLPIEVVVIWATRLKQAWQSADEHPENPHAGDEIDYAHDELKRAVREWLG